MKPGWSRTVWLGWALFSPALAGLGGEQNPIKNASDFSSVEYFDPPNQMQISSRLSGAEAIPQPDGSVVIRQFKLETFDTNGAPRYIVEAPECIYDEVKGAANSAGHLDVRGADGQVQLGGDGFLWQQDDQFLTISNQVRTVIKPKPGIKIVP